jgi:tRNA pseudouridine55 synthase
MIGFLNINKPAGMTAHDVVARVRRILRVKQVGHAGTLDPMAKGVLPIAVGKVTRLIRFLDGRKVYLAEILLGKSTTTDDIEGETTATSRNIPAETAVIAEAQRFVGNLEQLPPAYSAVHYKGERLYNLARRGEVPADIATRTVTVYQLEILKLALPMVQARIDCGAGTYIRSIARDLGSNLGCGGCLQSLVREKAGPFELSSAITLDELGALADSGRAQTALINPADILGLPCLPLPPEQIRLLTMGQLLPIDDAIAYSLQPQSNPAEDSVQCSVLVTYEGKLIAVCSKTAENRLKPEVVIANAD